MPPYGQSAELAPETQFFKNICDIACFVDQEGLCWTPQQGPPGVGGLTAF
jgi:hypothetical protein